ncbi:MAG: hypothetical protein R6X02_15440 [Enhygromyxa sp.]
MAATTPVLRSVERPRRDVALELVDDHFPLMLVRWVGHIQPQHVLRMIRFFDQAVERGLEEGKRIVHICDARDAALPNQLVRDMLVDWLTSRTADERDVTMASYVIAADPLIRGVVASLKWATGRGQGIHVVASLDQAVTGACEVLEQAGMVVPEVLRIAG